MIDIHAVVSNKHNGKLPRQSGNASTILPNCEVAQDSQVRSEQRRGISELVHTGYKWPSPWILSAFSSLLMRNRREKSWKNRKTRELISMLFCLKVLGLRTGMVQTSTPTHVYTHAIIQSSVCDSGLQPCFALCGLLTLLLYTVAQCPEDEDSIRSWWVCSTRAWKIPEFPHSHWLPLWLTVMKHIPT